MAPHPGDKAAARNISRKSSPVCGTFATNAASAGARGERKDEGTAQPLPKASSNYSFLELHVSEER